MTTPASTSLKPQPSSPSSGSGTQIVSDTDSHNEPNLTPDFTPSETPPRSPAARKAVTLDLDSLAEKTKMDAKKSKSQPDDEIDATPEASGSGSIAKKELKDHKCGKSLNKKGKKFSSKAGKKKRSRGRVVEKEDESSSSDDSSSSEDESDDSEEDSEDSEESDSSSSSSSSSESESEDERKKRKKRAKKAMLKRTEKTKRRAKSKKEPSDSEESDDSSESEDSDDIQAQIKALTENLAALKALKKQSRKPEKITRKSKKSRGKRSKKDRDSSGKKKKRASKLEFKRVDQLWDSSIHNYKLTDTAEDEDAGEYDQYLFTVRRKFNWENKFDSTVVDIKSQPLKTALKEVMDGVKGVSLVEDTPVVDPNMLFLYLGELEAMVKEHKAKQKKEKKKKIRKANACKIAHVKVLIDFLNEDYKETKATLYPLLKSNLITFDLLWALFKPNTIAYTPTYANPDEPRAFRVEYAQKDSSFMKGEWYTIEGRYLEYDGKAFGMGTMECVVESFKGARKISSLSCFPLKYHKDEKALREQLIARGRKFVDLKGMKYRFHKGMAFCKKKRSVIKVNINGRIMIDPAIFRRINPNYPISTVKPKDPDEVDSDSDEECDDSECGCCGSDDDEGQGQIGNIHERDSDEEKTKLKVVVDNGKVHVVSVKVDSEGDEVPEEKIDQLGDDSEGEKEKERVFTDDELLIASPVVHGFAFSEKMWLEFTVSGVNDIEWNEGAFGSLVLPDNQKSIVKALVESHTFHAAQNIDDVIQGKGKGLVAVLHGPPGTGKTLTAEGIAELLKCPLYMVSAGELGTDPRTLEAELNKILDIAHSWGAVLLLDEADVFLEKRTIQDIHRNALVSIFLRLLEYFQGILFLTTNRVETFDDAFQSRIHVALRYGELTFKAKRSVWTMFLQRVQAMEGIETAVFKEADYDNLARNNLNGRQIKNCVRTAQALAVNNKERLSMEHIKRVLEVADSFDRDLKGGTGYLDAMRSYT